MSTQSTTTSTVQRTDVLYWFVCNPHTQEFVVITSALGAPRERVVAEGAEICGYRPEDVDGWYATRMTHEQVTELHLERA